MERWMAVQKDGSLAVVLAVLLVDLLAVLWDQKMAGM